MLKTVRSTDLGPWSIGIWVTEKVRICRTSDRTCFQVLSDWSEGFVTFHSGPTCWSWTARLQRQLQTIIRRTAGFTVGHVGHFTERGKGPGSRWFPINWRFHDFPNWQYILSVEARFLRHLAKIIGPRATLASVVGPKLAMVFTVVRLCHDTDGPHDKGVSRPFCSGSDGSLWFFCSGTNGPPWGT